MSRNEPSHLGAVTVVVTGVIASRLLQNIDSRDQISSKIRVWVHSGIDDADDDVFACAHLVCRLDIQRTQVPLVNSDIIG